MLVMIRTRMSRINSIGLDNSTDSSTRTTLQAQSQAQCIWRKK